MAHHFKVRELLEKAELAELEQFTREKPARTVDECHEWLQARGCTLSRAAVHRWKRHFDTEDKFRASSEVARTLMEAAKGKDAVSISDAATLQLSQLLFEQFLRLQQVGEVETKELFGASMALKNLISGQRHMQKLHDEVKERQQKAVAEAEKVAKAGGGNEAVIGKVREILGIA